MSSSDEVRFAELQRRIDGLVSQMAADISYGKALYREFEKHCRDDEARHAENVQTLAEIQEAVREGTASIAQTIGAQAAATKQLSENFYTMLPTMRRLHKRETFRRAVMVCLRRWRIAATATAVSAGGLFVWLDGHWPKIAAMLRKLLGPG